MDSVEYERIVKKYIDTVYRIAISYTKNTVDADDIVQQTFVKLLVKKTHFQDDEHIKRWLIRVCVNECKTMFASFWRKNVGSLEEVQEEIAFSKPEYSELYDEIKRLPAKCSVVIYLFYFEGYASKEIAEILHIKEATVRTRLARARKLLRTQLKEACEHEGRIYQGSL